MSSETRVIRPFRTAEETQDWLNENLVVQLMDGGNILQSMSPGSTSRVSSETLKHCKVAISGWDSGLTSALQTDIKEFLNADEEKIKLVIVGKSKFLKRTSLIHEYTIKELSLLPLIILLEDEVFSCIHNGWEVSVAVVISSSLSPEPGLAWRRGTWLARVDFAVASPTEGLGFTPRALTDEIRREFSLSLKTTRFAQVVDGLSILDGETVDSVLEYYVDEELMSRLSASPTSPFSILEQARIFVDAASFVVTEACREEDFRNRSLADVRGSVVHKFLVLLAGDDVLSQQAWLSRWQQSPSHVIAQIEAHADLSDKIQKVMAGLF